MDFVRFGLSDVHWSLFNPVEAWLWTHRCHTSIAMAAGSIGLVWDWWSLLCVADNGGQWAALTVEVLWITPRVSRVVATKYVYRYRYTSNVIRISDAQAQLTTILPSCARASCEWYEMIQLKTIVELSYVWRLIYLRSITVHHVERYVFPNYRELVNKLLFNGASTAKGY